MVMMNSVLCLPVFSTRATTKLQSRTWVWNKYFAVLDTSTFRHHCQLWTGLQRWRAWRGGKTDSHLLIIHFTGALLYFHAQVLTKGPMSIEHFGGKDLFIRKRTWPQKTEYWFQAFGGWNGANTNNKTAVVPISRFPSLF